MHNYSLPGGYSLFLKPLLAEEVCSLALGLWYYKLATSPHVTGVLSLPTEDYHFVILSQMEVTPALSVHRRF